MYNVGQTSSTLVQHCTNNIQFFFTGETAVAQCINFSVIFICSHGDSDGTMDQLFWHAVCVHMFVSLYVHRETAMTQWISFSGVLICVHMFACLYVHRGTAMVQWISFFWHAYMFICLYVDRETAVAPCPVIMQVRRMLFLLGSPAGEWSAWGPDAYPHTPPSTPASASTWTGLQIIFK